MTSSKPAYRADHVGSLLRPANLIDAHVAAASGALPGDELARIEDQAIRDAVKLQSDIGIDVLSDGEFRRKAWVGDFINRTDGFTRGQAPLKLGWHTQGQSSDRTGAVPMPTGNIITGRVTHRERFTAHEANFLRECATGRPYKVTIPAASYIVARAFDPQTTLKVYSSRAEVLADVAKVIRNEIKALVDEGTPYIQIDNPHYPDYLMESIVSQWRAMGIDPEQALREDIEADNACLDGIDRSRTTFAMHFCRGNGGASGWHSEGSYEPVAEACFNGLKYDRLLLEYDSDRAGGFEPLRFIAKDMTAVLGLITTKAGELESPDSIFARIDAASKYVPLERLALSPQCGFASVLHGNPLTVEEEKRKLALVVSIARQVWG